METEFTRYFHMNLRGGEIDAFKAIVQLAAKGLRHSPVTKLSGNPCPRQAGLHGQELFTVQAMLEKLAEELGAGGLDMAPTEPDSVTGGEPLTLIVRIE